MNDGNNNSAFSIRTLEEHVDRGIYNNGYGEDELNRIWHQDFCNTVTNENRQEMMAEMMSDTPGVYLGIAFDPKSNTFFVKDGDQWVSLGERLGMRKIIEEYKSKFLDRYEVYTIYKMTNHSSHRERQKARDRLRDHFQFLRAFDCNRFDTSREPGICNPEVMDSVENLWIDAGDMKRLDKKDMYDSIAGIVKSMSIKSCKQLDSEIIRCLMQNTDYRQFLQDNKNVVEIEML